MKYYFIVISTLLVTLLLSFFTSQNSLIYNNIPAIYYSFIIIFIIQWIGFFPSFYFKTEHYFDLIGSFTFIITIFFSFFLKYDFIDHLPDTRSFFFLFAISIWSIRLGSFLFLRVKKQKRDVRFLEIKKSFSRYFMTWNLQGLWVFMCSLPAITSIYSNFVEIGIYFYIGSIIWMIGFFIEIIADYQKNVFRKSKVNKGKYITTGLWSLSRHPNYFGEILLWLGITIVAFPTITGFQYFSLISPLFVYILLTRISGINFLEAIGDRRWGSDDGYKIYKSKTPILFPRLFLK